MSRARSRFSYATLPAVFVVLLLLVVPAVEAIEGVAESPLWRAILFLVYAWGFVFLILVPWLGARPLRAVRRQLEQDFPNAVVSIAAAWGDDGEVNVGVVMADGSGITVHGESPRTLAWTEIHDVRIVPHGHSNRESIHVSSRDGLLLRFAPLGKHGLGGVGSERKARLVSAIRKVRPTQSRRPSNT